uniref:Uncharacterized protein n=1 Tax=Cannabis sativa TaxID=3483 RepID=A0A803QQ89_CANSA
MKIEELENQLFDMPTIEMLQEDLEVESKRANDLTDERNGLHTLLQSKIEKIKDLEQKVKDVEDRANIVEAALEEKDVKLNSYINLATKVFYEFWATNSNADFSYIMENTRNTLLGG